MTVMAAKRAEWESVRNAIERIPHYRSCTATMQNKVPIALLSPICMVARSYRMTRVAGLLASYRAADIPLYAGVILSQETGESCLIAPPIVEVHGDEHVLIDGLHRVFLARLNGETELDVAVVRGNLPPLPGDPLSWDRVRLSADHSPRETKFQNFKPDNFRPVSEFLDAPDADITQEGPR